MHWAIAVPFLTCMGTAATLIVVNTFLPSRSLHDVLSWTHRLSGVCLIVLPLLAVFRSRRDFRIHFYNIRQAWIWTLSDLKWLVLFGAAAINSKVSLPEQGKFNAAEKLNFMVLMGTYPLYIVTGLSIWLTHNAFLAWIVHFSLALMGTPLVLGHIYMAVVNPESRRGLQGMITGFVDRQWAKHHYRHWYRETFEAEPIDAVKPAVTGDAAPRPVRVLCSACGGHFSAPSTDVVAMGAGSSPMACPECGVEIRALSIMPDPATLSSLLRNLDHKGDAMTMLATALLRYTETRSQDGDGHLCCVGLPAAEATDGPDEQTVKEFEAFLKKLVPAA